MLSSYTWVQNLSDNDRSLMMMRGKRQGRRLLRQSRRETGVPVLSTEAMDPSLVEDVSFSTHSLSCSLQWPRDTRSSCLRCENQASVFQCSILIAHTDTVVSSTLNEFPSELLHESVCLSPITAITGTGITDFHCNAQWFVCGGSMILLVLLF